MRLGRWLAVALLGLACLGGGGTPEAWVRAPRALPSAGEALEGLCVGNHDGDTLRVRLDDGGQERVRLLGVDTPELAQGAWGQEARAFTSRLVHQKRVRLVLDRQARDRYRRLLAYVHVGDRFVNLALLEAGLATVLDYAPNHAHAAEFASAEAKAKAQALGIWHPTRGLALSPRDFRHRGASPRPGHRASARP